ncbi:MAG: hypothetical protein ACO38Q_06610 [Aquiluna sp.]|uniref:structural protein n=1 Tax=Synechococcus phage S-CBS2 TaxID=753084 RepID=UPI000207842B|nr:structural protein [Synechococcus phage S-CBS2]ADF42438.1 structural protein [Synechococcus phage S-CBS2]
MRLYVSALPILILSGPVSTAQVIHPPLKTNPIVPVANVIAKGEGNWDSVNRGRAGDTPGGIKSLTGKSFSSHTVGEVRSLQRSRIYAVGRYQLIPSTLSYAVQKAGVQASERFTPEVQNRLLQALLDHKRPSIGAYIRGEHNNLDLALRAMALEWSSVAWTSGRSYYGGSNRSHVTRDEAGVALRRARDLYSGSPMETSQ